MENILKQIIKTKKPIVVDGIRIGEQQAKNLVVVLDNLSPSLREWMLTVRKAQFINIGKVAFKIHQAELARG